MWLPNLIFLFGLVLFGVSQYFSTVAIMKSSNIFSLHYLTVLLTFFFHLTPLAIFFPFYNISTVCYVNANPRILRWFLCRSVVVPIKKASPGSLSVSTVGSSNTSAGLTAGSIPNIFAAASATPKTMINTTGKCCRSVPTVDRHI